MEEDRGEEGEEWEVLGEEEEEEEDEGGEQEEGEGEREGRSRPAGARGSATGGR